MAINWTCASLWTNRYVFTNATLISYAVLQSVLYSQHNETILHIPGDIGKYETDLISFISHTLRSLRHENVTFYTSFRAMIIKNTDLSNSVSNNPPDTNKKFVISDKVDVSKLVGGGYLNLKCKGLLEKRVSMKCIIHHYWKSRWPG